MYKTVYREGKVSLIEKKSEFIGRVAFVKTKEAAEAFIQKIRDEGKDATHHCTAYIINEDQSIQKYDDDGEPQKTAGPPILDVLKRNGLTNVVCVVTRYFGGTLRRIFLFDVNGTRCGVQQIILKRFISRFIHCRHHLHSIRKDRVDNRIAVLHHVVFDAPVFRIVVGKCNIQGFMHFHHDGII